MRRPLFITLIFLLLLRGMVGDAMATGMAAGHLQKAAIATEIVATHAHESRVGGHFDHEMTRQATEPAVHSAAIPPDCAGHASGQVSEPISTEAAGHCESCAACQACKPPSSKVSKGLKPLKSLTLKRCASFKCSKLLILFVSTLYTPPVPYKSMVMTKGKTRQGLV